MGNAKRNSGFSLIELMIALVAGLIVIGAVLSFTVATIRSNAQTVQAARLTQELRISMSLMARELRRAGYDRRAETLVGTASPSTRFSAVTIADTADCVDCCVLFSYNQADHGNTVPQAGEWRGFRRVLVDGIGVIQANFAEAPPACNGTSNAWVALTNPRQVNITGLTFDDDGSSDVVAGLPAGITQLTIREIAIALSAAMVGDPDVERSVTESVRIRADDIEFTPPPPPPPPPSS
jgi:prepilin-type N-terminal cleavage/methylation domain-containing protein